MACPVKRRRTPFITGLLSVHFDAVGGVGGGGGGGGDEDDDDEDDDDDDNCNTGCRCEAINS